MDDGGIVGGKELLLKVWAILREEGPAYGLFLNAEKCEWSWLNPECKDPCPIEKVPLVETGKIQMLGVPLGSEEFVEGYVGGELLPLAKRVMEKLVEFEDTQAAMYLLRVSFGIVRANHFMRTTPLPAWEKHAKSFDGIVRSSTESILGKAMPDDAYDQACVSSKVGGLGIRRVVEHAPVAFGASWWYSNVLCGEEWIRPAAVPESITRQRGASEEIDKKTMEKLVSKASIREKQRLKRLDCKHANAWITALPECTDRKDTIMDPPIYRTSVFRLLGLTQRISLVLAASKSWMN
jgi:hypothetical protein